ncbi:hypothetical protein Kpho01_44280 [Kitasatospora phosalacinea]|uniref:Uncharacterized protein n=1 Tax=Kitasatospora phosalacinea TaxID=2065 RepID=A0A9W6PKD9_9ACTN|nr:hypothetical protein Kpho01_44280 [Kitasatospora phosalacinea]
MGAAYAMPALTWIAPASRAEAERTAPTASFRFTYGFLPDQPRVRGRTSLRGTGVSACWGGTGADVQLRAVRGQLPVGWAGSVERGWPEA